MRRQLRTENEVLVVEQSTVSNPLVLAEKRREAASEELVLFVVKDGAVSKKFPDTQNGDAVCSVIRADSVTAVFRPEAKKSAFPDGAKIHQINHHLRGPHEPVFECAMGS